MDFESPDVEKDFPGLYASEAIRKCNESDFSDENHDKSFKKDLIIGKRKEKKDSKKDRGYATLEGESSPEEEIDSRSPCKSKKSKSFKFPSKKSEKREKSREKDGEKKDKDTEKEKKKDKEKKEKLKFKEKKRSKVGEGLFEGNEDLQIFGVDLATVVERNGCLDGVNIPLLVRNCIDCVHSFGINLDGLYKIAGMKSKVQALRKAYNARDPVYLGECDVFAATCLLKMFLRELPEPILTNDLLTRFEEAGAIKEVEAREKELKNLIKQLPQENRSLLGWLIVHFDYVTMHEKQNKLNAQTIAMTFSPVLQMSHRLLTAFLCHCKSLFSDVTIERYIPPLCPGSSFPEEPEEIALELKKQEFLLNQLHKEMSEGLVSKKKEEQLWEVQRIVTQLKRKLKGLQRFQEASLNKSLEEHVSNEESGADKKPQSQDKGDSLQKQKETKETVVNCAQSEEPPLNLEIKPIEVASEDSNKTENWEEKPSPEKKIPFNLSVKLIEEDEAIEGLIDQLKYEELLKFQSSLQDRIAKERELISKLNAEIQNLSNSKSTISDDSVTLSPDPDVNVLKLDKDYRILKKKMKDLTLKIFEERLACIKLKAYIEILESAEKESKNVSGETSEI